MEYFFGVITLVFCCCFLGWVIEENGNILMKGVRFFFLLIHFMISIVFILCGIAILIGVSVVIFNYIGMPYSVMVFLIWIFPGIYFFVKCIEYIGGIGFDLIDKIGG